MTFRHLETPAIEIAGAAFLVRRQIGIRGIYVGTSVDEPVFRPNTGVGQSDVFR